MKILHQNASEKTFKFICVWIFGIWFVYILLDPLISLAQYPKSLYFPAGFLLKFLPKNIFYIPVTYPFLLFLKISLLLSIGSVILGYRKKWTALGACFLLTVFEGIVRSFGHINHPELPLLFSVFVLTIFFFFEDSIDTSNKDISKYSIPLLAILFIVCLSYCFAGIHRLIARGIEIYGTNTITFWVIEEGKRSRLLNWHMEDLMLTNPFISLIIKVGFPLVTIFEILAPFCLVSRQFKYLWLMVMVPFHMMVWTFMGIFFWANFALYILFFDFNVFLDRGKKPWTVSFKSL
ncbi:MAG: hypothetical protein HQL14_02040 [Candidatus Omnitrophica bacterium]|nr:hypothetical protein [Candidatus Omnitrophota bacterium]